MTTIGDMLRQRAQELRDNRDGWVQREPEVPGEMCAAYNGSHNSAVKAVHHLAIEAIEQWLPAYVDEHYPDEFAEIPSRLDITHFNDSIVEDVDEVIVAFEKCAAELG